LEQARADLNAGRCLEARDKAAEAEEMSVVYGLFDDRPALILDEVERIAAAGPQPRGQLLQAGRDSPEEPARLPGEADDELPTVVPVGRVLQPSPAQETSKWRARPRAIAAHPEEERIKPCSGVAEADDGS
jgi:hypothetical protein